MKMRTVVFLFLYLAILSILPFVGCDKNREIHHNVKSHIAALNSKDDEERETAAKALCKIGPKAKDAIPTLKFAAVHEKNKVVQVWSHCALAKIGSNPQEHILFLIDALEDTNKEVIEAVAYALGEIGPPAKQAVPTLIEALSNEDWMLRATIIRCLGRIGDSSVVSVLIKALKDKNVNVRSSALYALGDIGPAAKQAIPAVREAVHDTDDLVMLAAHCALAKIGDNPQEHIRAIIQFAFSPALGSGAFAGTTLGKIGLPALPYVIEELQHPDLGRRLMATVFLRYMTGSDVKDEAIRALKKLVGRKKKILSMRVLIAHSMSSWKRSDTFCLCTVNTCENSLDANDQTPSMMGYKRIAALPVIKSNQTQGGDTK
ncbi:MAG TPA: HEAT repeat domain-containing protein [Armatimonadetes bacterium]|nr:HEAT repeat domain-containing protein [Armatimonadota bacterium]